MILLPASEAKAPVHRGEPLDLGALSFPELAPTRAAVLDALIEVSAAPDGPRRLGVPAGMSDVVRNNTELRDAPAAAVERVYSGVLYEALALSDLDAASRRRARSWVVVISGLWGALRLDDRIPTYRLHMCGRLPGLAHLPDVWRGPLEAVLPAATRRGIVVDCRSSEYATAWRPTGALAERTIVVRILRDRYSRGGAWSHAAKRARGLLVRRILTEALDPRRPEDLREALAAHFEVDLRPPDRPGRTWELHVVDPLASLASRPQVASAGA